MENALETAAEPDSAVSLNDGAPAASSSRALKTFDDVLALAGERRDAMLKVHIEEHVSLVKFDPAARSIDMFLLPGAPAGLVASLREKLSAWTGERWIIVLSAKLGAPPAGETRREREAADLAALKSHPAVTKVLAAFPGARILAVKSTDPGGG